MSMSPSKSGEKKALPGEKFNAVSGPKSPVKADLKSRLLHRRVEKGQSHNKKSQVYLA